MFIPETEKKSQDEINTYQEKKLPELMKRI